MAGPTLDATGLTIQTAPAIQAEALAALRTLASKPGLLAEPGTPLGVLLETIADRERQLHEALQTAYTAFSLDAAGVALDRIAQAFGLARKAATKSTTTLDLTNPTGAPIVVTLGSQLSNSDTGDQWETTAALTIGAGATETASIQATAKGATPVPAGITWTWITSGYSAITFGSNPAGTQGLEPETDAALRARWLTSYAVSGAGTVDALSTAVGALAGVARSRVFENPTNVLGITTPEIISNLPAKSFVAMVQGTATADEIAQVIWDTKPAGIEAWGSSTGTATDTGGVTHSIDYEAPAAVACAIVLSVTGSSSAYDAAINAALVAEFADLDIGQDAINQALTSAAFEAAGPDVTALTADINTLGVGADQPIAWNEYATFSGTATINHV